MIRFVLKENVIDFCVLLMRATLGPVRGSRPQVHNPYHTSPMSTININIYSQCKQTIFTQYIFLWRIFHKTNKAVALFLRYLTFYLRKSKKIIWDRRNLIRRRTDWREPKYFCVPNDHGRTFSKSEFPMFVLFLGVNATKNI